MVGGTSARRAVLGAAVCGRGGGGGGLGCGRGRARLGPLEELGVVAAVVASASASRCIRGLLLDAVASAARKKRSC